MSLSLGVRLGAYEIVALAGAGGMGEVYRAHDTKLERSVAVKVLPDAFAADVQRIVRFEREAKILASLNHPHIAALYGMEQDGGRHFLVMTPTNRNVSELKQVSGDRFQGGPGARSDPLTTPDT